MNDDQMLWVEKYRPQTIKDCILPDALKVPFQQYVDKKEIPNLILTGTSGVGKTTVARAMCQEVGSDYIMINGSDESGIDTLRMKVKGFAFSVSLYGNRKTVIIDEADYLTPNAQAAFRGVIEETAGNCSYIFTCNYLNRIIAPLHSRCAVINFKLSGSDKAQMASQFMGRVRNILTTEKIEFDIKVLATLITKFFPDYRRILNELQRYSVGGRIDDGILSQVTDVTLDELVGYFKNKNFKAIRKWVGLNCADDAQKILRDLYDKLSSIVASKDIPVAIVIIGKYCYQDSFAIDKEINLMCALTEIYCECEFT